MLVASTLSRLASVPPLVIPVTSRAPRIARQSNRLTRKDGAPGIDGVTAALANPPRVADFKIGMAEIKSESVAPSLMVLRHPQCQLISATGERRSDGFDVPDSLDAPGSPLCSFGRKAAVLTGSANPRRQSASPNEPGLPLGRE